jgi:hypothetical protein
LSPDVGLRGDRMDGLNWIRTGWKLATTRWGWAAAVMGGIGLLLYAAALIVPATVRARIALAFASAILLSLAVLLLIRVFALSKFRQSMATRLEPISRPFSSLNVSFLSLIFLVPVALSTNSDLFTISVALFSGGLLFAYGLFLMTTGSGRKRVFSQLHRLGPAGIVAYLSLISFYAILLFAGLTVLLCRYHALDFSTPNRLGMRQVSTFYSWHFANAIPLIDFNSTVKWQEPLRYGDARVGLLVVTFKLVAIAPIIATLRAFWLYRNEDQRPDSEPPSRKAESPRDLP